MQHRHFFTTLGLSVALVATPLWAGMGAGGQGVGQGQGRGPGAGAGLGDCDPATCLAAMPYETVDEIEASHLVFMREEEKLARDLYLTFAELWGLPQFANVALAEQQHMDSVKSLMDKYAIVDPIVQDERGVFANPDLQALYNDLLGQGQASAAAALRVAALVEEVDIADLDSALVETDNQDLTQVFSHLQRGSRNHLRAFAGAIEALGTTYTAQWLDQDSVNAILDTPMERGGQGAGQGQGGQGGRGGQGQGR